MVFMLIFCSKVIMKTLLSWLAVVSVGITNALLVAGLKSHAYAEVHVGGGMKLPIRSLPAVERLAEVIATGVPPVIEGGENENSMTGI
jgi:hypothetical protein